MPLAHDIKNDIKAAKRVRLPGWVMLCAGFGCFSLAFLFARFGKLDLALPTFCSVGVLGFTIAVKWKLRRRVWFWVTMTVLGAVHVLLILSIPWTTNWVPGLLIAPILGVDFYAMLWILAVVGKLMQGPKTTERGAHSA
ncbi:MAG TPA: hypothetical protein VGS59_14250 [Candidatus Acidoferrales bacterium]|nr:hypothetical protein [Candidatus Acidoferrales bacterium]